MMMLILFFPYVILSFTGAVLIGGAMFISGEKYGAYKMIRNQYEISYVINSDSCVTDTIIHINY